MNVRKAQDLRNKLLLSGLAIMMVGCYVFDSLFIVVVGVIVTFSCLIPETLYNKCPHCGKRLGYNESKYCHHCGGNVEQ